MSECDYSYLNDWLSLFLIEIDECEDCYLYDYCIFY